MDMLGNSRVEAELDLRPLGAFQIRIIIVCALVAMIDGFDTQAIGFMAPAIATAWGVPSAAFGPIFGAGLFGGLLGAVGFGALADRFGRKPGLLVSILIFSLATLATPLANSMGELFAFRVVTGIGLGGAMPSIIALTSEYAPRRIRATLVTMMFCGFPLGAAIGAVGSAHLIPAYGWQSLLVVGGVIPLFILPIVYGLVPESIRYLLATGRTNQASAVLFKLKMEPPTKSNSGTPKNAEPSATAFAQLFKEGRATATILLWTTFFLSLSLTYFLVSWIPTVAKQSGVLLEGALVGAATLNLGSIFGVLGLGRLIDRFGPYRVIAMGYAAGAMSIATIGYATTAMTLGLATFLSGFFAIGAQMCVVALAATYYPTRLRATGVGSAMGIGRIGGIAGPIVGGLLVGMGLSAQGIFLFTAATALLAAASVTLMGHLTGSRTKAAHG